MPYTIRVPQPVTFQVQLFTINVNMDMILETINAKHYRHDLNCSINAKPLGTILETINAKHYRNDLNCSVNAKHWAQSQRLSIPNTGHDLNYSINTEH